VGIAASIARRRKTTSKPGADADILNVSGRRHNRFLSQRFAVWLVRRGINSISLNPDTAIKTALVIADEEAAQAQAAAA